MEKYVKFLKIFIISFFIILSIYFIITYTNKHEYYLNRLIFKTSKIVSVDSPLRGQIFDKNGVLLVGNKKIYNLAYHLKNKENLDDVVNSALKIFPELDSAQVYESLNKGYLYEDKIIKKNLTDEEVEKVLSSSANDFFIKETYERFYPFGLTLKNIFGSVSKISKENKSYYLENGYSIWDSVGISGLEKEYEEYLKGVKAKYKVNADNTLSLISPSKNGSDLYLSIDINLVNKVNDIIKEELINAKKKPNTEYLNDTYVIISKPKTGEIISINGQRYLNDDYFTDISFNNITSSFTMGSVVKGATISVGYKYNLIDYNKKILDGCVKLANLTEKCSFQRLGYLDDIKALEMSSNYYQFLIAISLAGKKYTPNMKLEVSNNEFDIYRNMLASYGLGTITGIDLPNEKIGLIGKKVSPDLLLNLAIGQYDTYTPIELSNYINTLASKGEKRSPSLVYQIKNYGNVIYQNNYEIKENVDLSKEYYDRIFKGFYNVMNYGTGKGYMNYNLNPAGKTGTSESFLDTDNDGKIDTKTLSLTMAGFFPVENPEYSLVVVSPNASHNNSKKEYIYYITNRVSRKITDYFNSLNVKSLEK